MKKSDYTEVRDIINESTKILIMAHINPDGDSLGCMLALGSALETLEKDVVLLSPDGIANMYKFMNGTDSIVQTLTDDDRFDLCIVVDCDNLDRLGPAYPYLEKCEAFIEIDHHLSKNRKSSINIIDPEAAATGELIYKLLVFMNLEITVDIAENLMTAIVTDTGSFKFSNVRPRTFRIAASLLEAGASVGAISQKVYDTRSLPGLKLIGVALKNMQLILNEKVAYTYLSKQDFLDTGANDSDTEGIVNYTRTIKGVCVGILLSEIASGVIKVSFRSRDGYDVSKLAKIFNGGGHVSASGATIDKPLEESVKLVIDAVNKWMES